MKSLIALAHVVLEDLGDRCRISTSRDKITVTARVKHEGLSFLTIALPKFGKDLQKGLDSGFVAPTMFTGFSRHLGLPRFLGGFLELVFDRETGLLLPEPSIEAIRSLHQFTAMFGKVELDCSDARVARAMDGFIQCETEVRKNDSLLEGNRHLLEKFQRVSSVLFANVFTEIDLMVYLGAHLPKHGPGATAEKLRSNEKYSSMEWTQRLEEYFPSGEFLFPNPRWWQTAQDVNLREPGDELPVRVIHVPKTLDKPRIIAIEPTCMQYAQQSLLEPMTELIDRDDLLRSIMGNLDQEPNRQLAKEGSIYGDLATLDLSEASDRVSNQLVRTMFARWPHLLEAVDACRSRRADVPGYGVVRLAKFASMGSALCFAVEGMVFTTIVFMAAEEVLDQPVDRRLLRELSGRVRIYGDDIIVPVEMVHRVIELLETFGLKVNHNKSFWTGRFRESCGGDYYGGREITPIRVRRALPTSRKHVPEIVSTVALRNHLFESGYERSVQFLDGILSKLLRVYPEIPRNTSALGRWTYGPIRPERSNPNTFRPQIKACVTVTKLPSDILDEHGALMKFFLKRGELPITDRKHLRRAGRPVSVDIKTRWIDI